MVGLRVILFFFLWTILYFPSNLNITFKIKRIYYFQWIAHTVYRKGIFFFLETAYIQWSIQILIVLDGFWVYKVKLSDQNIEHNTPRGSPVSLSSQYYPPKGKQYSRFGHQRLVFFFFLFLTFKYMEPCFMYSFMYYSLYSVSICEIYPGCCVNCGSPKMKF